MLGKEEIAKRIAKEVKDGYYVNLGIGIPTLLQITCALIFRSNFKVKTACLAWVRFHSKAKKMPIRSTRENKPLRLCPERAFFDSAFSFGMIRSQHVDLTILGAMEVAENGDIANWKIPGKMVKGMGGAMDLVASAENIVVAMMHVNKAGESKILKKCTLPLTGRLCEESRYRACGSGNHTQKAFNYWKERPVFR